MNMNTKRLTASAVGACYLGLLSSCALAPRDTAKVDALSGATAVYLAGDRGAMPPASSDYEVLGRKDGIKNWAIKYDDALIRGGEFYSDKAAEALKDWGVKTIISISPSDKEREFCARHGFALVEIPFSKQEGPTQKDLKHFFDTLKTGTGPFYLHCIGGTRRAGVLGLAYRMHILNWPYERALLDFARLGGSLKDDHVMLEAVKDFKP